MAKRSQKRTTPAVKVKRKAYELGAQMMQLNYDPRRGFFATPYTYPLPMWVPLSWCRNYGDEMPGNPFERRKLSKTPPGDIDYSRMGRIDLRGHDIEERNLNPHNDPFRVAQGPRWAEAQMQGTGKHAYNPDGWWGTHEMTEAELEQVAREMAKPGHIERVPAPVLRPPLRWVFIGLWLVSAAVVGFLLRGFVDMALR